MAQLCYLATNLGYLICQYVQCSCYFEELEGRSGLLSVCLHSTRFWRVKARQGWSVLIGEVGCFDRNTSILCDVPWKRFCCSTVLPFYFPFALKLWNFVVKNAILVKETHTVCGCCRCRQFGWITSFVPQFPHQALAAIFLLVLTLQVPLVLILSETNKCFSENIESLNGLK